jgi:U5 snRNP spliceosome subunit
MQELSGGAPSGNGEAPRRIEGGPGGYDQGYGDSYDRDAKPWQRGPPPSDVAPWQQRGRENRSRDDYGSRDNAAPPWAQNRGGDYGYGSHASSYAAPGAAPGAAPWQQAAAPPPPGGQASYSYGGYPAFPPPPANMAAPPGLSAVPPPPGMGSMYYGAGSPPPPPPGEGPPPPPPSDQPPPPPPPA